MVDMKRSSLITTAAIALAAALAPAYASASVVELGATAAAPVVAPVCPSGVALTNCRIILDRTTVLQTVTNSVINPTKVRKAGWIVAFTVGLSKLTSNAKTEKSLLHILDTAYGGTPRVALTVLKPGPRNRYTVAAQSPIFHVEPYLGQVVQLPLSLPPAFSQFTALPVVPGEVIGLSMPTWAPVLSYNLSASKFGYRMSRMGGCAHQPAMETAQLTIGASTRYLCPYTGTRVEYSATEITNQPYPKSYIHGRRQP